MSDDETASPLRILYENRAVFLFGEVESSIEVSVIQLLLALDALGDEPITLYIDSPGGSVSAGLAIYDTMQFIAAPVHTVCIGCAASMAAWLLAAGAPGHRTATENSSIMLHQSRSVLGGKLADMQITLEHFTNTQDKLNRLLARHTGRSSEEIAALIQKDHWMTPEEAKEFGIIDRIALPRSK